MATLEEEFKVKFKQITEMPFQQQAVYTMNAFWEDGLKDDAEKIWDFVHYANEITKPKTGCNDMDEFQSHRFLEHFGETLTVIALRDKLRAIDIDMNKRMALVEYMVFWRTLAVRELCTRPQGSNKKEIDEAKAKLDEVQTSFDEVMKQLEEQKIAEKEKRDAAKASAKEAAAKEDEAKKSAAAARDSEAKAKKAEEDAKKSAEAAKAAEQESINAANSAKDAADAQAAAVKDLNDQQTAYDTKITETEKTANDASLSTVKRSKASNELAQLKSEDPLPLRKAKITADACLKKLDKAKTFAEQKAAAASAAAREAEAKAAEAESKRQDAEAKRAEAESDADAASQAAALAKADADEADAAALAAEEKTKEVEAAVRDCEAKMEEAKKMLKDAESKPGNSHGDLWWMKREITEKEKYMPRKAKATK